MHNVLIIFYIAFSIGNLFILPELRRFSHHLPWEPAVSRCMADNAKLISEFPAPTGKTASRHGLRRNSFVMSSIVPSGPTR